MTKKSWLFFGGVAVAGAVAAMRRRASDASAQAARRMAECDRILSRLDAQRPVSR